MFKLVFGVLAVILGVVLLCVSVYMAATHQLSGRHMIRAFVLPIVFIVFGVTWIRGKSLSF